MAFEYPEWVEQAYRQHQHQRKLDMNQADTITLLLFLRDKGVSLPNDTDASNLLPRLLDIAKSKAENPEDRDGIREATDPSGYGGAVGMSLAERNELQRQVAVLERQAVRLSQAEGAPMDDATKRELHRLKALLARPSREEVAAGDQLCKLAGRISPAEAEWRRQRA